MGWFWLSLSPPRHDTAWTSLLKGFRFKLILCLPDYGYVCSVQEVFQLDVETLNDPNLPKNRTHGMEMAIHPSRCQPSEGGYRSVLRTIPSILLRRTPKERKFGKFPLTSNDHHNFWNEFVMLFVTTF